VKAINRENKTNLVPLKRRAAHPTSDGVSEIRSILVSSDFFGSFIVTPQLMPPRKLRMTAE
jgi:hypothetical protein